MKAVPGILPTLLEMIYFFSTPTIDVEPFFSKKQNESFVQLALLTHLGEALAAIDRTVGLLSLIHI